MPVVPSDGPGGHEAQKRRFEAEVSPPTAPSKAPHRRRQGHEAGPLPPGGALLRAAVTQQWPQQTTGGGGTGTGSSSKAGWQASRGCAVDSGSPPRRPALSPAAERSDLPVAASPWVGPPDSCGPRMGTVGGAGDGGRPAGRAALAQTAAGVPLPPSCQPRGLKEAGGRHLGCSHVTTEAGVEGADSRPRGAPPASRIPECGDSRDSQRRQTEPGPGGQLGKTLAGRWKRGEFRYRRSARPGLGLPVLGGAPGYTVSSPSFGCFLQPQNGPSESLGPERSTEKGQHEPSREIPRPLRHARPRGPPELSGRAQARHRQGLRSDNPQLRVGPGPLKGRGSRRGRGAPTAPELSGRWDTALLGGGEDPALYAAFAPAAASSSQQDRDPLPRPPGPQLPAPAAGRPCTHTYPSQHPQRTSCSPGVHGALPALRSPPCSWPPTLSCFEFASKTGLCFCCAVAAGCTAWGSF
ncbi:PREDICTED: proline-rich protein 2-like [Chinchilla lanigera]|uniref:proline-rich protein 2-like n=1 Tax=Chinchilla lanigera TaxID=34839 RepID=UPI000698E51A|nr:PREDICTED: proline-rich protein 2-like [Chinchilla lanigera]